MIHLTSSNRFLAVTLLVVSVRYMHRPELDFAIYVIIYEEVLLIVKIHCAQVEAAAEAEGKEGGTMLFIL